MESDFNNAALRAVARAIEKGILQNISGFEAVERFEHKFSEYLGRRYVLGLSSGTAALDCAMYCAGVAPGTEVIVPGFGPAYAFMPVLHFGGVPVFCDIDPRTLTILPESIENAVSSSTTAILVLHLAGHPADMGPIMEIAAHHHLAVIEDCAQALGATYRGKKVGSFGDISCFSFHASKNLPAGEGGALTTNDSMIHRKAAMVGQHPARLESMLKDSDLAPYMETGLGWNFRMHPLAAVIGDVGLDYVDGMNRVRRKNASQLNDAISQIPAFRPTYVMDGCTQAYNVHPLFYHGNDLGGPTIETFVGTARFEGLEIDTFPDPPVRAIDMAMGFFPGIGAVTSRKLPDLPGVWEAWERAVFLGPPGHVDLDPEVTDRVIVKLRNIARTFYK